MSVQQQRIIDDQIIQQEERLLLALETVLGEVRNWRTANIHIRVQILAAFKLTTFTQEQVCETLNQFQIFANALRSIAEQLDAEIEETTDLFYDWVYD